MVNAGNRRIIEAGCTVVVEEQRRGHLVVANEDRRRFGGVDYFRKITAKWLGWQRFDVGY